MSVSSHLTPEPERRLWIILESMVESVQWADKKIGALSAFAAAQLILTKIVASGGPFGFLGLISLSAALPLGVFAFSPLTGAPKWFDLLEPKKVKPSIDDCLVLADDIAKYSHSELIARL